VDKVDDSFDLAKPKDARNPVTACVSAVPTELLLKQARFNVHS
jgi:hypothetical protein